MPRAIDLEFIVGVVDASIADAASHVDGVGLLGLRRKLRAVSDDPPPPSSRREIVQARIELERGLWVATTNEVFLPDVKEAFVAALRGGVDDEGAGDDQHRCLMPDDPWVEFDPGAIRARDRAIELELLRAQAAAIQACGRYEKTRKVGHLRDAVGEIDAAVRFRRSRLSSVLTPEACSREAERLGDALRAVLSPRAFQFFVMGIRHEIAIELDGRSLPGQSPKGDAIRAQLLSRGEWVEAVDQPLGSEGAYFVDPYQQWFEDGVETERLKEEAEEQRLKDERERVRAWEASRDKNARLAQTEAGAEDRLDSVVAESSVSREENSKARVEDGPQGKRKMIADLALGFVAPPASMSEMDPAMAEAVDADLKWRTRFDADLARREEDRQEYEGQLRSR